MLHCTWRLSFSYWLLVFDSCHCSANGNAARVQSHCVYVFTNRNSKYHEYIQRIRTARIFHKSICKHGSGCSVFLIYVSQQAKWMRIKSTRKLKQIERTINCLPTHCLPDFLSYKHNYISWGALGHNNARIPRPAKRCRWYHRAK